MGLAPVLNPNQFPLLDGRAGGQTIEGGTAASEGLTLVSTAHTTRGVVTLAAAAGTTVEPDGHLEVGGDIPVASVRRADAVTLGYDSAGNQCFIQTTGGRQLAINPMDNHVVISGVVGLISTDPSFKLRSDAFFGWSNTTDPLGTASALMTRGTTGGIVAYNTDPAVSPFAVRGAPSQTAPLFPLRQPSSTSVNRNTGVVDGVFTDSTDATRKGKITLKASDWTGTDREGVAVESDGTQALVGFYGVTPVVRAASPGTASGTDAAVINAIVTLLRNLGACL